MIIFSKLIFSSLGNAVLFGIGRTLGVLAHREVKSEPFSLKGIFYTTSNIGTNEHDGIQASVPSH